MKIEKVNDHQIRCTLTREDLADRELKLSELAYGTEKAKDLFYDIFGWDRTTGVPTRETLEKYDLADMADDLEKRGIYAQNTAAAE